MSQVTLLSLDITSSPDAKGVSSSLETDVNGQEHEFSKVFQRQVNAEENGKTHADKAKSTKADSASSTKGLDKDAIANSTNVEENSSLKTALDKNPQSAKTAEQSSVQTDNVRATESLTTEDELLAQEQVRVGRETLDINVNEQAVTDANKKAEAKTEPQSESPIDFLTMLSASEKLLTGKVETTAVDDLKVEQKSEIANHQLSLAQVKKDSVKHAELSELSQQIQQALNPSSDKTTSSTNKLTQQLAADPQDASDNVANLDKLAVNGQKNNNENLTNVTIVNSKGADANVDNVSGESFKLKPDVIQAEQTLSGKQLAELTKGDVAKTSKNQSEVMVDLKNKTDEIELLSVDKKRIEALAETTHKTANKTQDATVLASQMAMAAKSAEQESKDHEAVPLLEQEKLVKSVSDKSNKNSAAQNSPIPKVIDHTLNNADLAAANINDVKHNVQQITAQEQNMTSSEENTAVISQVVSTATSATKAQPQETNKVVNENLAKTAGLESLTSNEINSVKTEVSMAESELLFDKTEQSMLANTVKSAQQFGLHQTASTTNSHMTNEASNAAQLDAISNKHVADNVQQVKNNQIQLTETINIHRKDFVDSVKDKVLVMINQKLQQVDIKLDPPELGNVHVRVNLQGDAATVNFVVQNPQAKEALEQHMGKLREMLNESGVDVGEANVEQQNKQQQDEFTEQQQGGQSGGLNQQNIADEGVIPASLVKGSAVGVDFYA